MTTTQTDEIKTWQQRLEETCPALGPMHIHACVEEVNDAMQAEINDLRVALQEQAREGEAVAKVVLTKTLGLPTMQWLGLDKQFDLADGQLLYTTPQAAQPAHPSEPAQPEQVDWKDQYEKQKRRAEMWIAKYEKDIGPLERVYPAAQPEQGELAGPDQIEKIVDRYVDEYEFTDGENAYHSPNEFEQMLIKDAFYGLLVDEEWDAAWGAHIASLQSAQPEQGPST